MNKEPAKQQTLKCLLCVYDGRWPAVIRLVNQVW